MKYGQWGKIPITVSQAAVKKGKKPSERKKDLLKLKKLFPTVPPSEIERIYNESSENTEEALLNLSSLSAPDSQKIELLQDMFEGVDKSYIQQVFGECGEDIAQATAFIIEAENESETSEEAKNFGSTNIGFVNEDLLKKRVNKTLAEMVSDMFPNVPKETVLELYEGSGRNMIKVLEALGDTNRVGRERKEEEKPVKRYESEYPANIGTPKTKVVRKGYWAKDQNNYFLDGNNVDAVKKIGMLKASFPAIDDVTVKEIFFQMGDDLAASVEKLKELFPRNYREVKAEGTIFIPYPASPSDSSVNLEEPMEERLEGRLSEADYAEQLENMQRSRALHDTFVQAASNAAASGNFIDAKKLSEEGKKHYRIFRDAYMRTYMDTFRRNNSKFGQDVVDLHGLQGEEAIQLLDGVLKKARGVCRKIEVITVRDI
jgi:hypothetical protein